MKEAIQHLEVLIVEEEGVTAIEYFRWNSFPHCLGEERGSRNNRKIET